MKQLIFVYNADSGLFNSLNDFAHKILSPSTYNCNLCALTYGNFTMKHEWKNFVEQLPVDVLFLHKNDFENKYKTSADLPAAFIYESDLQQLISATEINGCRTLDELEVLVTRKLKVVLTDITDEHR